MKRDKTVLVRGALSLAVVALTLALGSCTQESIGLSMPGGDGMMVRVTFPSSVATRATTGGTEVGTSEENRLDRVTILVFNQDGTKLETVLSEDVTAGNGSLAASQPQWKTDGTLLVSPIQNPSSPKKIYAVANWGTITFDQATYTEAKLKEELTTITAVADINGNKAYPMLMSGSKEVASLSGAAYSVTVDMARQASKIKALFTIPMDVQNYQPQVEWQTDLMKITVMNVPSRSYVVGRSAAPLRSTLLNSTPIAVDDTKPAAGNQTVPATKDLKWSESIYINENPVTGKTQASKDASTCIVVQLPYKNRITGVVNMDNYYQIYINDTRDGASPHKVLRNTIYSLSTRIVGMGLPLSALVPEVNIDAELTVNSWEKGAIGDVEAPNYFFNIDRTYIEFLPSETSFQSSIVTDVPDWKLVKADGTTIFSYIESKTTDAVVDGVTYSVKGSVSNATVTVNRPITLTNFLTNKMFFIAKNLKVPFTVVVYDDGFIPNSVLTAAGWPADKLPRIGLQIAKRGYQILPSGVAGNRDPTMEWKISEAPTPGTAEGLGMGVSNTAAMKGAEHPAAQYCRDMGEGWFLPSKEELQLIYNAGFAALGTSYTFTDGYWSSTEHDLYYSFTLDFINNLMISEGKEIHYGVRCVKLI